MMQPSPTIATPTTVATLTPLPDKIAAAEEARRLDVAEMHEKVRGIFATIMASEVAFAKKHSVQFYENVVNTNPNNQQQMKGSCMCCGLNVFSTGSFKFAEHLMKCALCPREVRNAFLSLSEKTEGKRAEKRDIELMATEEAQLAAQDNDVQVMTLCTLVQVEAPPALRAGGGGGGGGGTRNSVIPPYTRHNTPYAGKLSCIMYNTYYIILCINMYYVLVPPGIVAPREEPDLGTPRTGRRAACCLARRRPSSWLDSDCR